MKLDDTWNGQLIYVERDVASSIRREPSSSSSSSSASPSQPSSRRLAQQHQQQQAQQHIQRRQAAREQAAKGASGSKLSQARVGRRASTIGLRPSSSKLGGKYGRGPARARAAEKDSAVHAGRAVTQRRDAGREGEDARDL